MASGGAKLEIPEGKLKKHDLFAVAASIEQRY